jgi:hypothetical protein
VKLPNRGKAYVQPTKLTDYLLSETHPIGRSKARFLNSVGFDKLNVVLLEQGLIAIATSEDVREVSSTAHGTKYVVDGILRAPGGELVQVRTVWIINAGEVRPRFVTAYPQ